jgi:hypothetical protein
MSDYHQTPRSGNDGAFVRVSRVFWNKNAKRELMLLTELFELLDDAWQSSTEGGSGIV